MIRPTHWMLAAALLLGPAAASAKNDSPDRARQHDDARPYRPGLAKKHDDSRPLPPGLANKHDDSRPLPPGLARKSGAVSAVPEPGAALLFGGGLVVTAIRLRRRTD